MHAATRHVGTAMAAKFLILGIATLAATGCTVDSHKQGDGDNVKIATPFGGMSIKTDEKSVEGGTGLPVYPGAVLDRSKDKDGHHDGAADINMSFGSFQFRVKAVSYISQDSSDKVLAFYRKEMGKFGTVIQCSGHQPVGTPTQTPDGLNCSDDDEKNHGKAKFNVGDDFSGKSELKAGSKQHQHIVSIDSKDNGTKFGLVALDLPGHLSFGDNKDKDEDKQ